MLKNEAIPETKVEIIANVSKTNLLDTISIPTNQSAQNQIKASSSV